MLMMNDAISYENLTVIAKSEQSNITYPLNIRYHRATDDHTFMKSTIADLWGESGTIANVIDLLMNEYKKLVSFL